MSVYKSDYLYVVGKREKGRLIIWQSKLFADKPSASVICANLSEEENNRVHRCRLEFPDMTLKKKGRV